MQLTPIERYLIGFAIGVAVTYVVWGAGTVTEFFLTGAPVVCQESFPRYHTACIYSRPGMGDQAVTFQIDGESVFHTEDYAGGDLRERISWDKSARQVTFHVDGLGDRTFDAYWKTDVSR
jgi:hypothetical protein